MTAGQRWTRSKPTQAGWYWLKRAGYQPAIVKIYVNMYVKNIDWVMNIDGEWQGPLTPNEATE